MNILFHIDSLGSGGAQRQIVNLAIGMARRGHTVEFNTYFPFDHFVPYLNNAGISVHTEVKKGRFSIGPLRHLRRHARRMKADAVIAFLRTPGVHAEFLKLLLPGVKVIVSERSFFPEGRLSPIFRATQSLHRLADAVTVNSRHQAARMVREFPWLKDKTHVVLNGYDLPPAPTAVPEVQDVLHLLALASVQEGKNPLALAQALRICRSEKGIPICIHWAGEPWKVDGRYKAMEEVDEYLARHDLADAWHWLGLRQDVPALFDSMHGLVHPSLGEGFANVAAEALIAGRPVLLGNIGDQPWLINQSEAGLLFDPTEPESIANCISTYHALSDADRARMGSKGRAFAEAHLSLDAMVDLYTSLCEHASTARTHRVIENEG